MFTSRRVGGDDGRVGGGSRFGAVDGDVDVTSSSDTTAAAVGIGDIIVVNSGRDFEPGFTI